MWGIAAGQDGCPRLPCGKPDVVAPEPDVSMSHGPALGPTPCSGLRCSGVGVARASSG